MIKKIAYEVLNDEEKRRIFDQYGEEGLNQKNQPRGHNPFADFFGFGGQQQGGFPLFRFIYNGHLN